MLISFDRQVQIEERVIASGQEVEVDDAAAREFIARGIALPTRYIGAQAIPASANAIGLVSCIMPTKDRRPFIARAVECFFAQTYEKKQLVVLDNGEPIADLLPKDSRIKYARMPGKQTTGALRNLCCQLADGEFIAHWDDDDWSHPDRLAEQVEALGDKQVTGYRSIFFHGPGSEAYRYTGPKQFAVGASLLYRRAWWQGNRFPAQQVGEDSAFVTKAAAVIVVTDGCGRLVASTHAGNTSPRLTKNKEYERVSITDLPKEYHA